MAIEKPIFCPTEATAYYMIGQRTSTAATLRATLVVAAASSLALYFFLVKNKKKESRDVYSNQDDRGSTTSTLGGRSAVVVVRDAPEEECPVPPVREIQLLVQAGVIPGEMESRRNRILNKNSITIVHGTMTGTCARFAQQLYDRILRQQGQTISTASRQGTVQVGTTEDWDWWDEFLNDDDNDTAAVVRGGSQSDAPALLVLLLPTYTNGGWPPVAEGLQQALQDLQNDWRVAKFPLKGKLQIAVFGMGSSEYTDHTTGRPNLGKPAREAIRHFQKLGAKSVLRLAVGDDAVGDNAQATFEVWQDKLLTLCCPIKDTKEGKGGCACGSNDKHGDGTPSTAETPSCCQSSKLNGKQDPVDDHEGAEEEEDVDDDETEGGEPELVDLEDIGELVPAPPSGDETGEPREMVTPAQAAALKKEGYRLIGTHSAVKLCRWTKHQLRGRGGCYKHTFYGITSYQCMEATPSLACANKCVFCWRHHKNPVGKEWRWKTDDPHFIVDEAVKAHVRMIKEARGIPGVQMDRWEEAHTVRHCALSLVGEPIMYPRIDELIADLHNRKISTFLVTNGQHPQAIGLLRPITQLYVSVDAPNRDDLIAIDRPLFSDAWDRLKQSLACLKAKGQRTVARLTVVKGWNSDDIEGYAKLIALGHVSLVEVKGVTFCGKSDASNLNMSNTPFHHEVLALTQTLKTELDKLRGHASYEGLPEYDLACEHKHTVSVLLARVDQFAVDDAITGKRRWRTWINYDKFHELASKKESDPTFTFSVEDYTAETPSWALFGSDEEGFDPTDSRFHRKQKYPKYTQFDERGIPTHDHNHEALSEADRLSLTQLMDDKLKELGSGSTVTELRGGARHILDVSLMFRGLVTAK